MAVTFAVHQAIARYSRATHLRHASKGASVANMLPGIGEEQESNFAAGVSSRKAVPVDVVIQVSVLSSVCRSNYYSK
jgi:hypothetical protein